MATKISKQIYLEPEQEAQLKRLAGATGLAEADLIRQALNRHLSAQRPMRRDPGVWAAERAFISALIALGPVSGARTWRRDELHER